MKVEQQRSPRLAVLIDAENVSPKFADGIFKTIAQLGDAPVRLIYGNLSGSNLKGWANVLPDHSLERRDQTRSAKGKNSADMALVIDAMDLLHDGRINGFCLSRLTVISQALPPGCGVKARRFMGLAKKRLRAAFSELAIGSSRLKISFRKNLNLNP